MVPPASLLALVSLLVTEAHAFAPARHLATSRSLHATPLVQRSSIPQLATPYRQDDKFNYYRTSTDKEVALTKPLGVDLNEGEFGVMVSGVQEGSGALDLLKKGDRITGVNGADVTQKSFDDVVAMIVAAPDQVQLSITRVSVTRKPRDADTVGKPVPKTSEEEEQVPSKFDKSFAKNFGDAESTAKILQKTARITANPTTWKNPIYFWSVAGTALIFVPIIWYSVSK